jgi:hypothetical protein
MAQSFHPEIAKEMPPVPNLLERPSIRVERRQRRRFPIALLVEYILRDCRGRAMTCDISSRGVFVKTNIVLKVGKPVRLLIDWPVELNGGTPLQLAVVGKVVRSDRSGTAVSVLQHEYRLRSMA